MIYGITLVAKTFPSSIGLSYKLNLTDINRPVYLGGGPATNITLPGLLQGSDRISYGITARRESETARINRMLLSQVSEEFKNYLSAKRDRYYAGKRLVSELKAGMSQAEVLDLMGKPNLPSEAQAIQPTQQWQYQVGVASCLIMLDFQDGKVVKFVFMG